MVKEYEYIIVGSGVAGATIANRLLKKDRKTSIFMLEAGPEIPAKNRRFWWDYVLLNRQPYAYTYDQPWECQSVGNVPWDFKSIRVKAYGGSTAHWGGWSLRFKPEDFEMYSRTGEGMDWPIRYQDLEGYYSQAEEFLSVCGDHTKGWTGRNEPYPRPPYLWASADGVMINAFRNLGIQPGKMPLARYRKCMTTGTCKYCPFGAKFSAQYVLDEIRSDERHLNFTLRCHAPVSRILTSSKQQIEAVEYLDTERGEKMKVSAKTFILCSGAYEVPKLLMNSTNSDWENGIGNDYDHLGRYLVSHSFLRVTGETPQNKEYWFQEYDFPTLMSRTYDSPEYQKNGKLFLFKNHTLPNTDIAELMIRGYSRKQIDQKIRGPMQMELQGFMEEKGRHENRLVCGQGKDRFGLPYTKIDFNRTEMYRKHANDHLERMKKVIKEMGYEIKNARVQDPGGHHASGTCRMGKTPVEGVTDANLRVHETSNLYICSNGVFPSGSAVNPTLTLTALSMRLADHLISQP